MILLKMDMQDVILCLVDVLKYKLANIRLHDNKIFRPEFSDVIQPTHVRLTCSRSYL